MENIISEPQLLQQRQNKITNSNTRLTYPMPLTLDDAQAWQFIEHLRSLEKKRAHNHYQRALLKQAKQTKSRLIQNKEQILEKLRRVINKKVNPVYLLNDIDMQQAVDLFFIRMLFHPNQELQQLKNYFFYSSLYQLYGGEQETHPIMSHHIVYRQIEQLSVLSSNPEKERYQTPAILCRYTFLICPTLEESQTLLQQIEEKLMCTSFLSLKSSQQIQEFNRWIMLRYHKYEAIHKNNFPSLLSPQYRMWIHKANVHQKIITSFTLSYTNKRCDQFFLDSVSKLFEIQESEFEYRMQKQQSDIICTKKTQQQKRETTKKDINREKAAVTRRAKYPVPFETYYPMPYPFLYDLHRDLQRAGLIHHRLDEIKDLFLKDRIKRPIQWTGTIKELYSFILLLQEMEVIHPKEHSYWDKVSKLFERPLGKKIKVKQLRKSKRIKSNHLLHKICQKLSLSER
ncbi:hypothetical protein OAT16_06470 [Prolixibacteraceae bacterium]|nr:hypothetical protein [Prolixibacteraceae bacterium]